MGIAPPCVCALLPSKSEEAYNRIWGAKKDQGLIGEADGEGRVFSADFKKSSVNATHRAFAQTSIAWCVFRLGQPIYRKVQELGLSAKYKEEEDFRPRSKTLSDIAPPPP